MTESKPYSLPNTEGRYITVSVTNQSGEVYRLNNDGTRTIYADYFVENGNTVLESSTFSSEEFQRNLAQNSQGYNRTISGSILDANGQTNSQPDPNQPGAAGGSTPTNANQEITEQTTASTDFKYPEDLSLDQDVIQFKSVKYIPSGLSSQGPITASRENQNRTIEGTVTLPIQAQINDSNIVGWGEGTLDELTRFALDQSFKVITNKFDEEKFAGDIQNKISSLTQGDRATGLALIAEKVIGLQGIQGRTGGILNPNVELLFNSPQLRPFSFTFRMTPRTKKESEQARGIIKFFKKNMAVKRGNGLFLKAPNTFLIKYLGKNENQQGANEKKALNKIKECALIGFDVNYTPQGTYMTFDDGSMVSYLISLSFKELVPIYDTDYKEDHPIGF
jgi:hypothetical protein